MINFVLFALKLIDKCPTWALYMQIKKGLLPTSSVLDFAFSMDLQLKH